MVPNHSQIVKDVFNSQRWDLVSERGLGEFSEAAVLALHKHDANWGHLKKYGAATQINGHAEDSALYKVPQEGGKLQSVDFIARARAADAAPAWGPDTPRYALEDWLDPTTLPSSKPSHNCRLGCSLFWAPAAYRKDRPLLDANLKWAKDSLGADYIRIIAKMGNPADPEDPWTSFGGKVEWLTPSLIGAVTDHIASYGLKTEWSLLGDMFGVETESKQFEFCDRFITALKPRLDKVEHLEVMNEYGVNGGTTHILRAMARRLRDGLPSGTLISLSSPNGVHGGASTAEVHAEVFKMYGGDSGGNMITPHWNREHHVAPDLGPNAPSKRSSNEPRGPFSSVTHTVDPFTLVEDYKAAANAAYGWYVYHSDPGVWSDQLHPKHIRNDRGNWKNLFDVPNAAAIAAALKAFRLSGASTPSTPTKPKETDVVNPYPDENTFWNEYETKVVKLYAAKGRTLDSQAFRWFTRPCYDIAAGMSQDAAAVKHLGNLRDALGLAAPAANAKVKPTSIIWADSVVWTD